MKRFIWIASVALASGTMALTGCNWSSDSLRTRTDEDPQQDRGAVAQRTDEGARTAGDRIGDRMDQSITDTSRTAGERVQPTVDQLLSDSSAENLRETLADITDTALTKGSFKKLCSYLSSADRDRTSNFADLEFNDLDLVIVQIQQDWKNKYGHDFDIQKEELVFSNVKLIKGISFQDAQTAGGQMAPAYSDQGGDVKNLATAHIPAGDGMSELNLQFVNEGIVRDDWRLNVADTIDGAKIKANLVSELKKVQSSSSRWPSDENEACRVVAHHVLLALQGQAGQRIGDRMDQSRTDTNRTAEERAQRAPQPSVDQKLSDSSAENLRETLADITDTALTKGSFKKLCSYLSSADRARIRDFADIESNDLDLVIVQIQQDWKNKYGHDFNIQKEELVFGSDVKLNKGSSSYSEGAQTAGGRMAPAYSGQDADVKNLATAHIPAGHSMSELHLQFVNEGIVGDDWRLNVADTIDGAKIMANLVSELKKVQSSSSRWPSDENEAYRVVAHHVFLALQGQGQARERVPSGDRTMVQ